MGEKELKKELKLYNVIFPIWFLWLVPITWIVVLPANFIIDLAVIVLTLKYLKENEIRKKAKFVILKSWIFGFISDFIGTAFMLLATLIDIDTKTPFGEWWYHNIENAVSYYPFRSIYSVLWISGCVLISGICIYFFNYKIAFKRLNIEGAKKKKLALSLAVFTAPYLFYLPTSWFFY